jgi:hypothetical protein
MVKENIHAKMAIIMTENGFLEKNKDLVYRFGKMDKCMKDNSKKDIKMEKEKSFLKIKVIMKEISN